MLIVKKIHKKKIPIFLFILVIIFAQKLALPFAGFQFSIAIFAIAFFDITMCGQKKAYVNRNRFIVFLLMCILSVVSCFINVSKTVANLTSLLYFYVIYFFFCFDYDFDLPTSNYIMNTFKGVLFASAIIGIMQYALQLAGVHYIDLFDYFPESIRMKGFNTYYPIRYGSNMMKSNGWFYLEPSFFSQFMALGIILETKSGIRGWKSYLKLIIYLVAIICSFSGTGILLLLVYLIPFFNKLKLKQKITVLIGGGMLLGVFLSTELSTLITGRISEFSTSNSSAAMRFINPYVNVLSQNVLRLLTGNGPGTVQDFFVIGRKADYTAIPKVIYEYGIFVAAFYLVLVLKSFYKHGKDVSITCLLFMYLFLAGNLLQPSIAIPLYFLANVSSAKGECPRSSQITH